MRLENWLIKFKRKEGGLFSLKESIYDYPDCLILVGHIFDREGFKDGEVVETSTIKFLGFNRAITSSGTVYKLGTMHPDYRNYMRAVKRRIPVLKQWKLEGNKLVFLEDENNQPLIVKKISFYDKSKGLYLVNGKEYFIDWLAIERFYYHNSSKFCEALTSFGTYRRKLDIEDLL